MLSFFKSQKNNPQNALKAAYYIREGLIHNIIDLNKLLVPEKVNGTLVANTKSEIKFKNFSLIGLTEKQIIAQMKQPIFIHDNKDILEGHKILFYKLDVDHYSFLVQFHFIDNLFFFVSNKVMSSGILSNKEKNKIVNQLENKYLGKATLDHKTFLLNLTDKNGSMLNIIDDVNFYVNYLCGCPTTNKLRQRYYESVKPETKDLNFEDTIDKLF